MTLWAIQRVRKELPLWRERREDSLKRENVDDDNDGYIDNSHDCSCKGNDCDLESCD